MGGDYMKPIWQGTISFGLVNIPIELYAAVQERSISFKLVHNDCMSPISYKKWCNHCNREVSLDEIEKAYQLPDGTYFIVDKDTLNGLQPAKSDTIEIVQFVDDNQIQPLYLDEHYYIMPAGKSAKAFLLFTTALNRLKKVAIGHLVLRTKEYACVMQPYGDTIVLSTLNYLYEIRQMPEMKQEKVPKISDSELKLAEQLINQLYTPKFDLSQFKDHFEEQLKEKIRKISKGIVLTTEKPRRPSEEAELIETLRASLKHHTQDGATAKSKR